MVDIKSESWHGDQCDFVRITIMITRPFNTHSLTRDDPGKVSKSQDEVRVPLPRNLARVATLTRNRIS